MSENSEEHFGEFKLQLPVKLEKQQIEEGINVRRESSAFSQETNLIEREELDGNNTDGGNLQSGTDCMRIADRNRDQNSTIQSEQYFSDPQTISGQSEEYLLNLSQENQNSPNQIEETKNEYTRQNDQLLGQPQNQTGIPLNQDIEEIIGDDNSHESGEIYGISHFLQPLSNEINDSSPSNTFTSFNSQSSQQITNTTNSSNLTPIQTSSSERSTPQRFEPPNSIRQQTRNQRRLTQILPPIDPQNRPFPLSALQQNLAQNPVNSNQSASSSNIGQYLGDLWEFDCIKLKYFKHQLTGDLVDLLQRSNHTAVYYEPKNSIYVFGGGGGDRVRFNDTLVLELPTLSEEDKLASDPASSFKIRRNSQFGSQSRVTKVNLFEVQGSLIPEPRTYHASCLLNEFMIVSAGEVNGQDSQDLWALNLETGFWFKVAIDSPSRFERKRFHTISAFSKNRIVSFGGCHDNYLHLNEVVIFYMDNFIKNQGEISVEKIKTCPETPSTRWGHAAAVHEDQLYICGGRSEIDISDLHSFNIETQKWSQIELGQAMPKPRRRHSVVFVGSSLLMFGGFDGEFYQDLHMLDLSEDFQPGVIKERSKARQNTLTMDYAYLVDQEEHADLKFVLDSSNQNCEHQQVVFANKSLILYRLYEREIRSSSFSKSLQNLKMEEVLSDMNHRPWCPDFILRVFDAPDKSSLNLPQIYNKGDFLTFLTFCYTEKVIEPITGDQIGNVIQICKLLGLPSTADYFQKLQTFVRQKIEIDVLKKFTQSVGLASQNLRPQEIYKKFTQEQASFFERKISQLMGQVKFSFDELKEPNVEECLSPEDYCSKNQYETHLVASEMSKCRNLDVFFDVVFELEDESLIRANSAILQARSDYFKAMFSQKNHFGEYYPAQQNQEMSDTSSLKMSVTTPRFSREIRHVKIYGIEKGFFCAIIQFIYTENFCQTDNSLAFLLRLMIFADYFLLSALKEVCQTQIMKFVQPQSVLDLFLVAHAHNASKLEQYCLNFIVVNLQSVKKGIHWMDFVRRCTFQGKTCLLEKLESMIKDCYLKNIVSVNLLRQLQMAQKFCWQKYQFETENQQRNNLQQNLYSLQPRLLQDGQPFQEISPFDQNPNEQKMALNGEIDQNGQQLTYTTKVKLPSITRIINLAVKTSSKITNALSDYQSFSNQQVFQSQNRQVQHDKEIEDILNISSYIFIEKCDPIQIEAEPWKQQNIQRQQLCIGKNLLGLRQPLTALPNQNNLKISMANVEANNNFQFTSQPSFGKVKSSNQENQNPFVNQQPPNKAIWPDNSEIVPLQNIFQQNGQESITMINTCQEKKGTQCLALGQSRRSRGLEQEFVFKENQNEQNALQFSQLFEGDSRQNSKMDDLSQIPEASAFGMSATPEKIVTNLSQGLFSANQQVGNDIFCQNEPQSRPNNLISSQTSQQPFQLSPFQSFDPNKNYEAQAQDSVRKRDFQ